MTLGTVVAHECVCSNITHADHAQSADTFRDVRDFLKPSYTPEKNNLANFAAVLHDCVFTSATEMDSNGRTFSVFVPHCLLLSFWKKDVPPPETWHAILQLTKSRVNMIQRLSNHHTTPGPTLQLSV